MTARRTHVLVAALSFTTAATLSACGGSGGDDPTTQSVDEYAKTQAAKRKSTTKTSEPSSTPTTTKAESSPPPASSSKSTSEATSSSREPLPNEPTDQAQVAAATKFVKSYISALNSAFRNPATRNNLDASVTPRCKSCDSLKSSAKGLGDDKHHVKGNLITFKFTSAEAGDERGSLHIYGTFKQEKRPIVDAKGKAVGSTKEGKGPERAFEVVRRSGNYKINAVRKAIS